MDSYFRIEKLNPQLDGDHPIDLSYFTNAELHTIKKLAGVRAGELEEAFEAGDNDLTVAFAVVALQRAGKNMTPDAIDALWNAPVGKIQLVAGDEEEEADDGPPSEAPSATGESGSAGAKTDSSGPASRNAGSSHPGNGQSSTGSPPSETTAASAPATSPV